MIAFDASALLAFLFAEPGAERVASALSRGCVSAVNLAEVLSRFARDGHAPGPVAERLAETALEIVPFGEADASAAADLARLTRPRGLSLGDRACLALARARGVPAMTADRLWAEVDVGVEVQIIR